MLTVKLLTGVDTTDGARKTIRVNEASAERVEHLAPEGLFELREMSQLDLPNVFDRPSARLAQSLAASFKVTSSETEISLSSRIDPADTSKNAQPGCMFGEEQQVIHRRVRGRPQTTNGSVVRVAERRDSLAKC